MEPLRAQLYNQIQKEGTYSLDTLSRQYGLSKPAIKVQLQRMKEEGKQINVTDDEVSIFLNHNSKFWLFAGYIFMGFILALLFGGWIHG